jgi:hypothetical protein
MHKTFNKKQGVRRDPKSISLSATPERGAINRKFLKKIKKKENNAATPKQRVVFFALLLCKRKPQR